MKYAIIIPDGCADEPQESLNGKTPLQRANVPAMDEIAAAGVVGRANNVPAHLPPGSDVANLSLLGYDPNVNFTGRAPLEAAAQGIELGPEDWAIRCNLVTVENQIMRDFTAGHVSSGEAKELLQVAQERLVQGPLEFVPGVSYRNLLLFRGAEQAAPFGRDTHTTPPHDLTDKSVAEDYPRGPGSDLLDDLMSRSIDLFANHPVNVARRAAGKLAATNIWLWGLGKAPSLQPFQELHGKKGKMITAVDLLRGLAALIGWDRIEGPGATGYTDTDYAAKGRYAIEALRDHDIVCVHVEAPDEASHEGRGNAKVEAIERIDKDIVGPILEVLPSYDRWRILISPDHSTLLKTRAHDRTPVAWTIAGSGIPSSGLSYDEAAARDGGGPYFDRGYQLMEHFLDLAWNGQAP